MNGVARDIREIGRLMASAELLMAVRREVSRAMKDGFVVTDGRHHEAGQGYDVVVKCGGEGLSEVSRRIRSGVTGVDVERLADGVLGVRTARRGRRLDGI